MLIFTAVLSLTITINRKKFLILNLNRYSSYVCVELALVIVYLIIYMDLFSCCVL